MKHTKQPSCAADRCTRIMRERQDFSPCQRSANTDLLNVRNWLNSKWVNAGSGDYAQRTTIGPNGRAAPCLIAQVTENSLTNHALVFWRKVARIIVGIRHMLVPVSGHSDYEWTSI
jgi:hypothetical protein